MLHVTAFRERLLISGAEGRNRSRAGVGQGRECIVCQALHGNSIGAAGREGYADPVVDIALHTERDRCGADMPE